MRRALKTFAFVFAISATVASAATATQTYNLTYFRDLQARNPITTPLGNTNSPPAITSPAASLGPVTPVPEPSTWALLLGGLVLVGFVIRRSRQR